MSYQGIVLRGCVAALLIATFSFAHARADQVDFTGTQTGASGTGFGNILNLLTLQATGAGTTEFGSVLWNGVSDDETDDAKNQSETQTVAALLAEGIMSANMLGLILNVNEAGSGPPDTQVVLNAFTLRFQDATGATLFDIDYTPPTGGLTLDEVGGGTGGSGWLFTVEMSAANESLFFGDPTNRVGMIVTQTNAITGVSNGAENFYLAKVPEPASLILGCFSLAAFLGILCRRKPLTRHSSDGGR